MNNNNYCNLISITITLKVLTTTTTTLSFFSTDIDECATGAATCDHNADCTDTVGSYKCKCKTGYVGNGRDCTSRST